ncbi:MAG TPA: hypothetical protein VFX30_02135 [bacterium]|nr:hypothetical protein [bacterium]
MGNQNLDTGRGQEKNLQNPGQNPNIKNPQQGQKGQNQGQQQGFDKNRDRQNPPQGTQRASDVDEGTEEEVSEKEDLYGNRKP